MSITRRSLFKILGVLGVTPLIARGQIETRDDDYWEDELPYEPDASGAPFVDLPRNVIQVYSKAKPAIVVGNLPLTGPFLVRPVGHSYKLDLDQHETIADVCDWQDDPQRLATEWDGAAGMLRGLEGVQFGPYPVNVEMQGFVIYHENGLLLGWFGQMPTLIVGNTATIQWPSSGILSVS
jgi:hypothetical protein